MPGLDRVGLGQIGIQRERPFGGRQSVIALSAEGLAQDHLRMGHQRPGARIAGVDFGRARAQANDRRRPPGVALVARMT